MKSKKGQQKLLSSTNPASNSPMGHCAFPNEGVAEFWDDIYAAFDPTCPVKGALELPEGVERLAGKSILIVACGTGGEVVRAAREAASVTAIDISEQAVANARAMIEYNGLQAQYYVGDAGRTGIPDGSFDIIWGSAVLHHLNHAEAAPEFLRLLKPGGRVVMVSEPTFFNPILRWAYETAFGKGRVGRRRKFLFLRRIGDDYEKPIDAHDLSYWSAHFEISKRPRGFMFIEKIGHVLSHRVSVRRAFARLDAAALRVFPTLKDHGYEYDFIFTKPTAAQS